MKKKKNTKPNDLYTFFLQILQQFYCIRKLTIYLIIKLKPQLVYFNKPMF